MSAANLRQRIDELKREWSRARVGHPGITYGVAGTFAVLALATVVSSAMFLIDLPKGLPDDSQLSKISEMDQATSVFDASDGPAFTIFKEQRIEVPLAQMSPRLIQAILAIEDQRFYDHHGFDAGRIVSAAIANIRHRRVTQGASTITQQLARQSFLTREKTIHRKLQEVILAARIERRYTKDQILQLYLNKVYFGDGLYGVEAASRGFFAKRASDLDISEAATLAGLVKSPSSYAPTINLRRATARRNVVLQAMLDNNQITKGAWQAARDRAIVVRDGLHPEEGSGEYFKEQVRRELVDRFGWQRVYQGGLRVYSTIDMKMQAYAETAVAESLKAIDERRHAFAAKRAAARKEPVQPDAEPLQAALVAMDPVTGHVRAMVGGRDFAGSRFNRAVQAKRQPGSAFKPFVYATALEAGYTPATLITNLDDPIATPQGAWTPDDHSDTGPMTVRSALKNSSNRAAVRVLQQVGIARTVQNVRDWGVGNVPSVPSLALGSGEVTLQSMTAAYAAFANEGLVPEPTLIRRVEDREGHILYEAHNASHRAISETTAFLMSSMLADVVNAGTGSRARQMGFTLPAAGKTGTTNDFNDAWFVGFTPSIVAGVWVGFDQPHTILPNGFAADLAVPMWTRFMKSATDGDKPAWLSPPSSVTTANVCRLSGKLASEGCNDVEVVSKDGQLERRSMVYTEYFAAGTVPQSYCDLHQPHGFMTKLAGWLGGAEKPPAPNVDHSTLPPPPPAATAGVDPSAEPAVVMPPETPKKRGFWARLFGRDGAKNDKREPQRKKDRE